MGARLRVAGAGHRARDGPPVVPWWSWKVGCRDAPSHHPGDTRVRAQAGDGVDPRGAVAAVPTAQADRERCHAHAGMGAWMGQHLGGVHACLTTAGVARRDTEVRELHPSQSAERGPATEAALPERQRGVLAALIRVMDDVTRLSLPHRHLERREHYPG